MAAVVSSLLSWLTWGSTGPITNAGITTSSEPGSSTCSRARWPSSSCGRSGQRPGIFAPHPKVPEYRSYNLGLVVIGVVLIFAGLPMVILSCGFFFDAEALFVSVTMADTSIGIAFNNLGLAWAGGAITGASSPTGPRSTSTAARPVRRVRLRGARVRRLRAVGDAPRRPRRALVAYAIYEWLRRQGDRRAQADPAVPRRRVLRDLAVGLIEWGTAQGGYFGVTEGDYAFQHAEINLLWQAVGLALCIAAGLLTGWLISLIFRGEKGLRASEEVQVAGYDARYWDIVHDLEPASNGGADGAPLPGAVRAADGDPAMTEPKTTHRGHEHRARGRARARPFALTSANGGPCGGSAGAWTYRVGRSRLPCADLPYAVERPCTYLY